MRKVVVGGKEMELIGEEVKVGEKFPNFIASDSKLEDYDFSKSEGIRIILAVPSVDTPICDMELKKMGAEVAKLEGIKLLGISKDLPFAQTRWCVDTENEDLEIVSDFKYGDFAKVTGTLIKERGLLTRASFVIDQNGNTAFAEYLESTGYEPSYDKILEVAKGLR
ncbi:MAG: thiol peroxidase [Sarcina sp.]